MGLGTLILRRQRRVALGVHAVVPLLPAHHRRPAQALLQAPDPLPAWTFVSKLNAPAHAAGLGLAGQRCASPTSTSRCVAPASRSPTSAFFY